jgi:hypothetical protein
MFDRLTLAEDLIDCRGEVLAPRGFVVSPESIAEAATRAAPLPRRRLADAVPRQELAYALGHAGCRHLFQGDAVRAAVEAALLAVRLPEVLWEELAEVRAGFHHLWRHALVAASTAVRMLLAAVGPARGVPDLAAAALVHDLGMRHLPARILRNRDRLTRDEATAVAAHPLLGAYHLARVLGAHPAVSAARSHHWRCGQGYPGLSAPPSRSIEVVSIASAFAALVEPRPFRSEAYDARGATDVLVAEAAAGFADPSSVRLLVHALRGGRGEVHTIRFGHERSGHAPEVNRHTPVVAPDRSPV